MLFIYKLATALLIALVTILVGLGALRFIKERRSLTEIGDALADGIFLGVALFHLLPTALTTFQQKISVALSLLSAIVCLIAGFILLFLLERHLTRHEPAHQHRTCTANAWMLASILSVHAFIAGVALGMSSQLSAVIILLVAILAHKGFESYALVMGFFRHLPQIKTTRTILFIFSLVTPLGIILASLVSDFLQQTQVIWITAICNAFAAGSFLYIGTRHSSHMHFHPARSHQHRLRQFLITLLGIALMAVLAIWI